MRNIQVNIMLRNYVEIIEMLGNEENRRKLRVIKFSFTFISHYIGITVKD